MTETDRYAQQIARGAHYRWVSTAVFPISYMDDVNIAFTAQDKRTPLGRLADWVVEHFKRIAAEHGIILEAEKETELVCRKGKRVGATVKILGVIVDDTLQFCKHADYRAEKGKQLWGALHRLGNTKTGISPSVWRQLYTGMVRPVMT